jgi:hypothetical protein
MSFWLAWLAWRGEHDEPPVQGALNARAGLGRRRNPE